MFLRWKGGAGGFPNRRGQAEEKELEVMKAKDARTLRKSGGGGKNVNFQRRRGWGRKRRGEGVGTLKGKGGSAGAR